MTEHEQLHFGASTGPGAPVTIPVHNADERPAALRIDSDGTITFLPDQRLETLQAAVGPSVDVVWATESISIWASNEEGLAVNALGTLFWERADEHGCVPASEMFLVGPCVITGSPESDPVPAWATDILADIKAKASGTREQGPPQRD